MTSAEKEEAAPFLPTSEPSNDDVAIDILCDQSRRGRRRYWMMVLSLCAGATLSSLLWLVAWGYLFSFQLNSDPTPSTSSPVATSSCGSSYSEAITNNCIFQLWSYSWVPPECFDRELNDEFLALRDKENWHYYSNRSSPIQVPLETVLTGTRNDLWSTWGQHYWHCAFYQRKFFRIVDQHDSERTPTLKMTNRDLDEHHSKHCQEWLAKPDVFRWDDIMIKLTVGHHSCS